MADKRKLIAAIMGAIAAYIKMERGNRLARLTWVRH